MIYCSIKVYILVNFIFCKALINQSDETLFQNTPFETPFWTDLRMMQKAILYGLKRLY